MLVKVVVSVFTVLRMESCEAEDICERSLALCRYDELSRICPVTNGTEPKMRPAQARPRPLEPGRPGRILG